ncbi:MAG: MFS transporter [Chitinophagaceae bacterium]|nr:MFS transporter [Chitinophagaceae bacterium]MCZ2395786.1 MFS transporter [Chitinophagales bacterium]
MAANESTPSPPLRRGWILAALMFTIMLAAMDATIVSTAIPQIVGDLGGFSLFSWVFSIYLLAQTITIPLYGKLADLYGRKPILIFGTILFLVGSAASASSWNMTSLILFRGLQGLGAGSIMATVNTLAGDIYSISERAKIQGWLSSVWGMAAIVGPSLGGAFAEYASWRWIFLINLPIGIVAIILIGIFLKENVQKHEHKLDIAGALFMLLAGVSLIFTLMQSGQAWPWLSAKGIGLIVLSVILIALTVRIEQRSREPIMPNWVWKNKILLGTNLAVVGMGALMLGPNMYLPVYAQSVMGLGAIAAGLILASMSFGWPVASSLSGILYLRIGFRNTAIIGTVIIILSSVAFLMLPFDTPVWLLVIDQIMIGFGLGFLSTPTLVGVQSIVPWGKRGVVTGSNMFSRYLGQSIGAAILGGIFNMAMGSQLTGAPGTLKSQLPSKVNDVIEVLQSGKASGPAEDYLRHSFYVSAHHVYIAMAILAALSLLALLMLPKEYPIVSD